MKCSEIWLVGPKSFFFTLIFLAGLCSIAYPQKSIPDDFDTRVELEMKDWGIPGMAIAVVRDGEIIYEKGFGLRRLAEDAGVDEHTVFGIASVSKNMTAAALAILVDEGKLNWDDRVKDHIPWFEFSDPWVSAEVTVRDLLTHRVGVGRMLGNRLQFMTSSDRDEVIFQMRYMDFEAPFRYQFVYSNVMYSVAGQLIEYIEGVSWDDFLKNRLFETIGMTSTNTSITQLEETGNVAWPHQEIHGKIQPIQRRNWDNAGPAGGVNSSVHDLAKWMLFQLDKPGSYGDTTIISERQMREIHRPQIALPPSDPYDTQSSYGLGWRITDYQGQRILTHGGATDGFNTSMYMIPEMNIGLVVVTNVFNWYREAVSYTIIDHFLGVEGNNWNETYLDRYNSTFERVSKLRQEIHDERNRDLPPTFDSKELSGVFSHPAYGHVEVFEDENGLKVRFWRDDDSVANLEHWQGDTYRSVWENAARREEFCWFTRGKDGSVDRFYFEFCLRPLLLQVGAYPSNYMRVVGFVKEK